MTTAIELPPALHEALQSHHARFSPLYQEYLSDHGPMGILALHGLGYSDRKILDWYALYCRRLQAIDEAPAGYRRLLDTALAELSSKPPETLLAERLPDLISGWARNAYHPLIRLAYAYQFGLTGELAAGLAYLEWCGPDRTLERLARDSGSGATDSEPEAVFEAISECAARVDPGRRFDDRLRTVIDQPVFHRIARKCRLSGDAKKIVSRLALDAFHGSHDFFALHLVTGAHAFRVLYPFAGAHRDTLFLLGILAGYAAAGAPGIASTADGRPELPFDPIDGAGELRAAIQGDDEHDIKLAYSCLDQAACFEDPDYLRVAMGYLERG